MDGMVLNTDTALCNESKNVHLLTQVNILAMPCLGAGGILSFSRRKYLTVRGVVEHSSAPYAHCWIKNWEGQKRRTVSLSTLTYGT